MTNDARPMTTAELEALPIGSIIDVVSHNPSHYVRENHSIWLIDAPGNARLLSDHAGESEALEWFASDSESRTGEGARPLADHDIWNIRVVGFDVDTAALNERNDKLRIYINRKLDITPNKRAAHAVHAALRAFGVHPGCKVIVLDGGPTKIIEKRVVIADAGHTELEPGTITAGTDWPGDSDE